MGFGINDLSIWLVGVMQLKTNPSMWVYCVKDYRVIQEWKTVGLHHCHEQGRSRHQWKNRRLGRSLALPAKFDMTSVRGGGLGSAVAKAMARQVRR
jgi:hypothetical protein